MQGQSRAYGIKALRRAHPANTATPINLNWPKPSKTMLVQSCTINGYNKSKFNKQIQFILFVLCTSMRRAALSDAACPLPPCRIKGNIFRDGPTSTRHTFRGSHQDGGTEILCCMGAMLAYGDESGERCVQKSTQHAIIDAVIDSQIAWCGVVRNYGGKQAW